MKNKCITMHKDMKPALYYKDIPFSMLCFQFSPQLNYLCPPLHQRLKLCNLFRSHCGSTDVHLPFIQIVPSKENKLPPQLFE